jgi:glutaredoxin-like YruB-family protein
MKDHSITIYSTTWCGYCKMAKKYLDDKGITYADKNIETEPDAQVELIKKLNGDFRGVPVIDIDGQIILGFDRPKIDAALAL